MGTETSDDAGVYKLTDDLAVVLTADFITPPVDDPYVFGQIAATNALSDVYAMGGRPVACLNLVGFPSGSLEPEVLGAIIEGAVNKIREAGASLAGGHTTEDEEPKFGLSVTGVIHPDKIWRNSGAREGDQLILTKPIGSGVLINAHRKGWVEKADMDACVELLITLNRKAAETMAAYEIHAATDVTGFGLAGHGFECAEGAGLTLRFEFDRLPIMAGSLAMYKRGMSTGANRANRELVEGRYRFEKELPAWHEEIVFDPQTAGGLLVALPPEQVEPLLSDLHKAGVGHAVRVGEVLAREKDSLIFA